LGLSFRLRSSFHIFAIMLGFSVDKFSVKTHGLDCNTLDLV